MKTFKKIAAALSMAAVMMAFSACSSEDSNLPTDEQADGTATFTFNCIAPGSANSGATSRAYSDGQKADDLYYALYTMGGTDGTTPTLVETNVAGSSEYVAKAYTFDSSARPKTTVELKLAMGQKYTLLFFGMAPNAPYTFDPSDGTITVDYDDAKCNDENRDAFYTKLTFTATKANTTISAILHRPFAQVNVGTAKQDFNFAKRQGMEPSQSKFIVKGAYSTLDMFSGDVSNPVDVTYDLAALPDAATEVFPVQYSEGHSYFRYLAMNYVLVNTKENFDCEFAADTYGTDTWVIENVPMQRNHRTNIYGGGSFGPDTDPTIGPDDPEYDPEHPGLVDPDDPNQEDPSDPGNTDPENDPDPDDPTQDPFPYNPDEPTPGLLSFFQNFVVEIDPNYLDPTYEVEVDYAH